MSKFFKGYEDTPVIPRDEVKWFSAEMEKVLKDKDHLYPNGWKDDSLVELWFTMMMKTDDVIDFINVPEEYTKEQKIKFCVDIANFAMMIADKVKNGEIEDNTNSECGYCDTDK